jgi:predicted phage terminase large subunit-like protein
VCHPPTPQKIFWDFKLSEPKISRAEAAKILLARRAARSSFLDFAKYALEQDNEIPASHHELLISWLDKVERGECKRLMVFMPPGAAKTKYGTILFTLYYLARAKNRKVILASYASDVAEANSGKVIRRVPELATVLNYTCENEAVSRWRTTNGGEVLAAGVGSRVTSFRGDLAIVDDPVKGREEADSEVIRDKAWAWFWADLHSRLTPKAAIILIMTRWHEDDLAGRFLTTAPEDWDVLKLPAQALDNDPLGRAPGDFLWSGDPNYDYGGMLSRKKEDLRKAGSMREWQSLYQQDPRPGEGALFDVKKITLIQAAPAGGRLVRAWDLAGTAQMGSRDPDWTRGFLLQETPEKGYVIVDLKSIRGGPDQVEALIRRTAREDGTRVKISIPQDPAQAGKMQSLYYAKALAGYNFVSQREGGDKATRATPFASQVNVGNVSMVIAPWNKELLDEMGGFPSVAHDDIVDSGSTAFAELMVRGAPARSLALNLMGR